MFLFLVRSFWRRRARELRAWRSYLDGLAAGASKDGTHPFLGIVADAPIPSDGTWAKANVLHSTRYGQATCYAYLRENLYLRYVSPPSGGNTANRGNSGG